MVECVDKVEREPSDRGAQIGYNFTCALHKPREIINQTESFDYTGKEIIRSIGFSCPPVIVYAGAVENDEQYAEASADSPSVDSLDDDDDNEELDSSSSNEYPDGDNDNDESYDDADDDRQESRAHSRWLHPDNN